MTYTEQFVEKYNLRQKKYVDLSFVGDAYDYATFELAVSDANANTTANALTSGTGAVRVFKGEDIAVIRLLQDIKLTTQTQIKNNVIVDFNGFTMSEEENYKNNFFLITRWIADNPIGVVLYARNGGTIQTNNRTTTLALVCEYSAVIGLTINNHSVDAPSLARRCAVRIGNTSEASSCESKNIIEDCFISVKADSELAEASVVGIYDINCKNTETVISNAQIIINNKNYYYSCDGVWVEKYDNVIKKLKMINCEVKVDTTQEQATHTPRGIVFDGEQLILIDCSIKVTSTITTCYGIYQNGTARIQNSDIVALSPNLDVGSAIGIYVGGTTTSYLKDTNVFGVTSGIENHGIVYIDGGYLRSPGHGGLYNCDYSSTEVGAKAYVRNATFARAIGSYKEFGATYNGADGSVYQGYGSFGWFDNCEFLGAVFVNKWSSDDADTDKGSTAYISNCYSEDGYRCDNGTSITFGTGMTGNMNISGNASNPEPGTINYTEDDYSEVVKANVPKEFYATITDYLSDLHKAKLDLANLVGANNLTTINTLTDEIYFAKANLKTAIETKEVAIDINVPINTYSGKIEEVFNKGYEKGKSEGGGFPEDMEWTYHIQTVSINTSCFTKETETITMMRGATLSFAVNDDYINTTTKHIIVNYNQPPRGLDRIFYLLDSLYGYGMQAWERLTFNADTSNVISFRQMFNYAGRLTTIDGTPLDFSNSTNNTNMFKGCSKLAYIRIVPDTIKSSADFSGSSSWDDESLQSIIDGLADLTGGTAQTITWHADVKEKLTDEQKATITGKNWTIA